jgi:endonuclease YncB( thermonuclease family)
MKYLYILLVSLLWLPGVANSAKSYGDFNYVQYVSVTSANSFLVNIPGRHLLIGDKIEVLIKGIEIPKKTGVCEKERHKAEGAEKLISFLLGRAKNITLKNIERDRRFRLSASVLVDGKDIRRILIKKGVAVKNLTGKKGMDWCR